MCGPIWSAIALHGDRALRTKKSHKLVQGQFLKQQAMRVTAQTLHEHLARSSRSRH